jgi:hypothetical protein
MSASNTDSLQSTHFAKDKNLETYWSAGQKNLQWINYDFEKSQNIGQINLTVYSNPASNVNIKVYAKTENIKEFTLVMYKFLSVKDRDKIVLNTYIPKATSILITEDNKESVVGFREIQLMNSY